MSSNKGRKLSAETRAKMSAAHLGKKRGPLTAEHKAKIAAANKGRKTSKETRAKLSKAVKAWTQEPKHQARLSEAMKLRWQDPEWIAKMHKVHKNKTISPETRTKISLAHTGPKSRFWRGGISQRYAYGWGFNDEFKDEVRRRDEHKCQLCGVSQLECKRTLSIHHIDYNKKNSDPVNLITLCRACHARTNVNRDHWSVVLKTQMLTRIWRQL